MDAAETVTTATLANNLPTYQSVRILRELVTKFELITPSPGHTGTICCNEEVIGSCDEFVIAGGRGVRAGPQSAQVVIQTILRKLLYDTRTQDPASDPATPEAAVLSVVAR